MVWAMDQAMDQATVKMGHFWRWMGSERHSAVHLHIYYYIARWLQQYLSHYRHHHQSLMLKIATLDSHLLHRVLISCTVTAFQSLLADVCSATLFRHENMINECRLAYMQVLHCYYYTLLVLPLHMFLLMPRCVDGIQMHVKRKPRDCQPLSWGQLLLLSPFASIVWLMASLSSLFHHFGCLSNTAIIISVPCKNGYTSLTREMPL